MTKALIIEDEKPAARRLERLLQEQEVEVLHLLHSVKQAVDWLQQYPHPSLIFLDIQLSDGLSFEIFEKVSCQSPIIFTTAYDSYTLKAFKLNSVDYLLKPIDETELAQALTKFRQVHNSPQLDFNALKKALLPKDNYRERFTIFSGEHIKILSVAEITCFASINKITHAYTAKGKTHIINDSLEQTYTSLDPTHFFRVSRKHIVHLTFIEDILHYTNARLEVKLKNYTDKPIIVSRERVKDFKEWLEGK